MVKGDVNYKQTVDQVMQPSLYLDAMKELGVKTSAADMQAAKLADGIFDPNKSPEAYARSFPIHSVA